MPLTPPPGYTEGSDYNEQLAELTTDISVKQRLIDELERSQRRLETMRQHYEEKLHQLSDRIKATELERDKVLSNISESGWGWLGGAGQGAQQHQ